MKPDPYGGSGNSTGTNIKLDLDSLVTANPFTMEPVQEDPVPVPAPGPANVRRPLPKRVRVERPVPVDPNPPPEPEPDTFRFAGFCKIPAKKSDRLNFQPRRVFGEGLKGNNGDNGRRLFGAALDIQSKTGSGKSRGASKSKDLELLGLSPAGVPGKPTAVSTSPMKITIGGAGSATGRTPNPKRSREESEAGDKDNFRFDLNHSKEFSSHFDNLKVNVKSEGGAKISECSGNSSSSSSWTGTTGTTTGNRSSSSSTSSASASEDVVDFRKAASFAYSSPVKVPIPISHRNVPICGGAPGTPGIGSPITSQEQVPPELRKYWKQRYELFEKFDAGIQMDHESWYSVTPESIANHVAARAAKSMQAFGGNRTILDGFGGCGGNTIQFAKYFKNVITVDIDPVKTAMARHNARIYGVDSRIRFITGSFYDLAPHLTNIDGIFLSPPWGGPDYNSKTTFRMEDMNGWEIVELCKRITPNLIIYCPRNIDKDELVRIAGPGAAVEIEENSFQGRPKAITAYFGKFIRTGEQPMDDDDSE